MRIILIGYGKMGKELEKNAIQRGHEIVAVINSKNAGDLNRLKSFHADVAIEFTRPGAVIPNIRKCFEANIPVVVGTTGWYDQLKEIKEQCFAGGHSLIYASNFSVGVNILFELNRILAGIMNHQPDYDVSIEEIHHTQKLDAPSGTAITIANDIIERLERKVKWINPGQENMNKIPGHPGDLPIYSSRTSDVIGTHVIRYASESDEIELRHEAKSRLGFVTGALIAAEWIAGKKGFFTMRELLQLEKEKTN